VGALGGFASAVGLAVVALLVLVESLARLASPVGIRFDEAIAVAALGLAVNLASAWLLRDVEHGHDHGHPHEHEHQHQHEHEHGHDPLHRDHNLRAAYLHVLADALTSVLAIVALLAGRTLGWTFMDPVMGIVGSIVIARWSLRLLRETGAVLLDAEVSDDRRRALREALERSGDQRVADLHVWRVGPRHLSAVVTIVARDPLPPDDYKARLRAFPDVAHVTVEVQRAP
jgi:cation diffusion facilitator family transporter